MRRRFQNGCKLPPPPPKKKSPAQSPSGAESSVANLRRTSPSAPSSPSASPTPSLAKPHLVPKKKRLTFLSQEKRKLIAKHKTLYLLFLLPALITAILFQYRPMVGVVMAFQDFDISSGSYLASPFIGLENFRTFLANPRFYQALKNTLGLGLYSLALVFPLPIIFALLLNEVRSTGVKRTVQTITYLPHFLSWVVVATMVYRILDPGTGIVNQIRLIFGAEALPFMREPKFFWHITIFASIWKEIGWSAIIYIAAIASIDPQLYEAALIDGAGRFRRMLSITLPSIASTIALMFILKISSIVSSGGLFDAVFNLSNPMVNERSYTLEMYAYYEGIMSAKYSYATAITLTQSLVGLIVVITANKIYKSITQKSVF